VWSTFLPSAVKGNDLLDSHRLDVVAEGLTIMMRPGPAADSEAPRPKERHSIIWRASHTCVGVATSKWMTLLRSWARTIMCCRPHYSSEFSIRQLPRIMLRLS
jgi:hypothetical protein